MKFHLSQKFILPLLLLVLVAMAVAVPVTAQTKYRGTVIRLSGQPEPYYDIELDPGGSYSGEFIIQHEYEDENKELLLYVDATDFTLDPETGDTVYPENSYNMSGPYALADWVTFSRDQVSLNRYGQEERIMFTVDVPSDATPGTRYANIIVSNASEELIVGREQLSSGVSGAGIASRIVVGTLLVNVGGERAQSVTIEGIHISGGDGEEGLFGIIKNLHPINVSVEVLNSGNQGLLAGGDMFIHGGDNLNHVFSVEFNPERHRVLPNTARYFDISWDEAFATWGEDGNLSFDTTNILKLNWGRYFAEVNLLYTGPDGNLKVVSKTAEFWVLPWKALVVILIVVAMLVVYKIRSRGNSVTFVKAGEPGYHAKDSKKKSGFSKMLSPGKKKRRN